MPIRRDMGGHRIELFADIGHISEKPPLNRGRKVQIGRTWGWDCLVCNAERSGFKNMRESEQDAMDYHDQLRRRG